MTTGSIKLEVDMAPSYDEAGTACLESLARAARQVGLYGPEHPIAAHSLEQTCQILRSAAGGQIIEILVTAKELIWNGIKLSREKAYIDRFYTNLRDRFIESITINSHLHTAELSRLLMILAEDAEKLAAAGGAEKLISSGENGAIRIREVDWGGEVNLPDNVRRELERHTDENDARELALLVSSCAGSPEQLAVWAAKISGFSRGGEQQGSPVEVVAAGVAHLIQRAGEELYYTEPERWKEWCNETSSLLERLTPRWRALVMRAPAGPNSEYPDMLALVSAEMEMDTCVSAILDHPKAIQAERSQGLALALERILADQGRRVDIEVELHARALKAGISESVYQNVVGMIIDRLRRRQEGDGKAGLNGLINSAEERKREKSFAIDDLQETTQPEQVAWSRLCLLGESLATQLTISRYGSVTGLLSNAAEQCAVDNDLKGLLYVLSTLSRAADPKHNVEQSRCAIASSAVQRCSTESIVSLLTQSLVGKTEEAQEEIIEYLGLLGEIGLGSLRDLARAGTGPLARKALYILAAREGPDIAYLRELITSSRGAALDLILRIMIEASPNHERIALLLSGCRDGIKIAAIRYLFELREMDASGAVRLMLHDPSPAVRLEAVKAIAQFKVNEAAVELCQLLELKALFGEDARLREKVIETVAELRAQAAVPSLCRIMRGESLLAKLVGHRVRIAAVRALATIGGLEAKKALQRGCRSIHPGLRTASKDALSSLTTRALEGEPTT